MGSVRKDPRGKGWQVRYRDTLGKQRTRQYKSKVDANAFLQDVETQLARKMWVDPDLGKMPFGEYAEHWRRTTSHLRDSSLANLDSRLQRHILPVFGKHNIAEIAPVDVRTWVSLLVKKELAPPTISAIYGVFSRIMNTAVIDSVISKTPCIGVKLPRNTFRKEMNFLSPTEITDLAEHLERRYRTLIFTAAYTGMRWGELAGLRINNCNMLTGTIHVVEALTETNGHIKNGPTKNGKVRTISIPKFLVSMLNEHITTYGTPNDFVFTSAEGKPLRRNFYRRHFRKAVARSGVEPKLRFHDLRHTCVALLIAQGAHPKEIQERLGHSTIKLTFDRYGHLLPTLDDRLRDGLDEIWEKTQKSG